VVAVALVAAAATLSGCGRAASADTTITLYNGQHPQTTDALVTAFEHRTGITVLVRSADEAVLANQVATEGAHSPADVIYAENSPALQFLAEKGLLAPVDRTTLAAVPAKYNSPDGQWVGVSARVSCLVYNTSLVRPSQVPRSVLDLASPRWRGKLGLAPGETDLRPVVTSVDRSLGDAATVRWLRALKANAGSHVYPDNETLIAEVNSGQVAVALIDQYYWYRLRAEIGAGAMHSALALFAPRDPGYVLSVSGAAVLRSSRHQTAAQRFLAFMVSAQGQNIISHTDSFEYPIGSGVTTVQAEVPLASLQPAPVPVAALGDGSKAVALLQEAQLL
jgi:iron(III) transport system substrate-binding protein